jgi:hypothetical protein
MSPQEIIDALSHSHGKFPREAMEAAIAERETITPVLLETLERVAATPQALPGDADSYVLHLFAMYLLAQFRETHAFAPLVKICLLPHEDIDFLLGDVITEGLPAILASVCGGDIAPIKSIIENRELDEFVRGAGMTALVTLVAEGALVREDFIDYLREFSRTLEHESPMWNHWAGAADEIYPEELMPELRAAFDAKLIDPLWMTMKDIEYSLGKGRDRILDELRQRHTYVRDAVAAVEWWACFREPEERDDFAYAKENGFPYLAVADPDEIPYTVPLPFFRDSPKVGRNDPCPCGSGKKYKKCCM